MIVFMVWKCEWSQKCMSTRRNSLFAFFIDVIHLVSTERRREAVLRMFHRKPIAPPPDSPVPGVLFLLVGGVVVADHLCQNPLLVSVHSFHPRRHLVALLGHVVAAGWSRSTQRRGAEGDTETLLLTRVGLLEKTLHSDRRVSLVPISSKGL